MLFLGFIRFKTGVEYYTDPPRSTRRAALVDAAQMIREQNKAGYWLGMVETYGTLALRRRDAAKGEMT